MANNSAWMSDPAAWERLITEAREVREACDRESEQARRDVAAETVCAHCGADARRGGLGGYHVTRSIALKDGSILSDPQEDHAFCSQHCMIDYYLAARAARITILTEMRFGE